MRYGILSDIHANWPALERALEELGKRGVEEYLCLGDVVGYGPWPNECCDRVRELAPLVVRGNHDEAAVEPGKEQWFTEGAAACILWTREVLTPQNAEFLRSLKPLQQTPEIQLCHGSVPDQDWYTSTPGEAMLSLEACQAPLILFGHTHYAEWYTLAAGAEYPDQAPQPDGGTLPLSAARYMVNPGSVGQPRDGNPLASAALYDSDARELTILRFSYDIAAVQRKMREAGLPDQMALRLLLGI